MAKTKLVKSVKNEKRERSVGNQKVGLAKVH